MTVTGANVTIENVTFGDNAALVVNTTGDFTLTNCQFAPNTEYGKDVNVGVRTAVYLKIGGTATVTNNTFEGVDNGYYNAIEFGIGDDHSLKMQPFPAIHLQRPLKITTLTSTICKKEQ